jgi:geranylgeranyl diphosphate synthase, type II
LSYPDDLRQTVDAALEHLRFSAAAPTAGLEEAMRYSLLAGGKRVRPVLALATAKALGAEPERFLPVACAIELIHTYSLIHDDLPAMDDDELRRGQPTAHVKYGEDVAILAGDGLFAEAVRLFCEQPGDPARVLAALRELAAATGVDGMVGGQYVDVIGDEADAEGLRALHALKTGRLIAASVGVVPRATSSSASHMEATSDMENSPTSASSGWSGRASLRPNPTPRQGRRWPRPTARPRI